LQQWIEMPDLLIAIQAPKVVVRTNSNLRQRSRKLLP
jgi:hypothetical protein